MFVASYSIIVPTLVCDMASNCAGEHITVCMGG